MGLTGYGHPTKKLGTPKSWPWELPFFTVVWPYQLLFSEGCGFAFDVVWFRSWNVQYSWVVGCWLQPVTFVIIKNTKNTNLNDTKKCNTQGGKIINKRDIQHTLVDSRFCSLRACQKNEKYKRTKCNLWINGNIQKIQNTKCIFGSNGKIPKIQSVFFGIVCIVFVFVGIFTIYKNTKKTDKINTKTYEHNFSKMQNTIQYEPNSSNMSQGANPMFILKSKNQLAK